MLPVHISFSLIFADEELEQLKREFMHYQLKKEEYDTLKNEIDAIEGEKMSTYNLIWNTVAYNSRVLFLYLAG